MSTPTPKPGERWARTQRIEGEVVEATTDGAGLYVRLRDENRTIHGAYFGPLHGRVHHEWERLPDPEPEYVVGHIYQDASGLRFMRMRAGWTGHASAPHDGSPGWGMQDRGVTRPLVRFVPEVKP